MAVALVALFVALGGSAVAASGQISRLINGTSIKRGTLPGDRLKRGTVKGDRIARRTLTGTQVNVARLGTVPKAKAADTAARATNATTAQNAVNASSVGGVATKRFLVKVATGGAATTVLSLGGVTLTGACPGGRPTLSANTAVDNAWMRGHFLTEATATGSADTKIVQSFGNSDFDTNETVTLVEARPRSASRWSSTTAGRSAASRAASSQATPRSARPARVGGARLPLGRKERADDPEDRDEDPDDEHDPVTLADRGDAEGDEQDHVEDAEQHDGGGRGGEDH